MHENSFEHVVSFDIMSLLGGIPGLSDILNFLSGIGTLVAVVSIIYSLIQCYFGYIIFRVMLVIQGMIAGLAIGAAIGVGISFSSGGGAAPVVIAAIICCILGGILAHALYKLGVFLFFFLMFGFVGIGVSSIFGCRDVTTMLIIGAVIGVIGGIIGVILDKQIIIFSTAICFGASAGFTIGNLANQLWLSIVLSILFIVTGILAQNAMTKKKSKNNAYQPVPANMGYQNPPVNYAQPVQYAIPCAYCGNPLSPDSVFCPRCGKTTAHEQPAPVAPAFAEPITEPAPVAPTFAEPITEPAPVAPTFAEPMSEPATNYFVKPTPNYFAEPAPVAPTYPEPTFESAMFNEPSRIPAQTNEAPAFCTACGAKLEFPITRFCSVCGSKIEW